MNVSFRMTATAWLFALTAGTGPGCSQDPNIPERASFDRPQRAAFACFQTRDPRTPQAPDAGFTTNLNGVSGDVLPLHRCDPTETARFDDRALHVLVTQTERGEVAAVDLQEARIRDSDQRIPGATFVPVGEAPTGIVVPPRWPRYTYVADFGSQDVLKVPTTRFRQAMSVDAPLPGDVGGSRLPLDSGPTDIEYVPPDLAPGGSAPDTDGAAEGGLLFVPLPQEGAVVALRIGSDGGLVEERRFELTAAIPPEDGGDAGVDGTPNVDDDPASQSRPLDRCVPDYEAEPAVALEPSAPDDETTGAQPVAVAFDGTHGRLFVADRSLPQIHVIDLDGDSGEMTLGEPLRVDAPTTEVVITPVVPARIDRVANHENLESRGVQYAYAIDAEDGSVMALDLERRRLLGVQARDGRLVDRIPLGSRQALSIEVMTPFYPPPTYIPSPPGPDGGMPDGGMPDDELPDAGADPMELPERSAERLRGVFLAIGATDARVHIVDIHDTDLDEPEEIENACALPDPDEADDIDAPRRSIYMQRHLPRIAGDLRASTAVARVSPRFVFDDARDNVEDDGTIEEPGVPTLNVLNREEMVPDDEPTPGEEMPEPIITGSCPPGLSQAFPPPEDPDTAAPRVCITSDPWSVRAGGWRATFEGSLPGASGGRGQLEGATPTLEDPSQDGFCERGVLGNEAMAAVSDVPEPPLGDVLAIRFDAERVEEQLEYLEEDQGLARAQLDACEALLSPEADEEETLFGFAIERAAQQELTLSSELLVRTTVALPDDARTLWQPAAQPNPFETGFDLATTCLGGFLVRYEVHARGNYLVAGGGMGFDHEVQADPETGACRLDGDAPTLTGRAFPGVRFQTFRIAFEINETIPRYESFSVELPITDVPGTIAPQLDPDPAAILPTEIRFSTLDQHLYVVDMAVQGLIRLSPDLDDRTNFR